MFGRCSYFHLQIWTQPRLLNIEGAFGGLNSSGSNPVYSYNHDDNIIAYVTPL
jgi:hypothetical protein